MKINGFGKATVSQIQEFEKHIRFKLPQDYIDFLLEYNGGTPEIRYPSIFVEKLNESIPLHVLFGFGIDQLDLYKWNNEYSDDMLPNCIIIGHDPGECMLVLVNSREHAGVYAWDHSWYFPSSNADHNVYKLADSFYDFLEKLNSSEPDEGE